MFSPSYAPWRTTVTEVSAAPPHPTLDMLLCIVPKVNPDAPTVGPALLKAHLLNAGFTCEVLDLNIQLYNHLKKSGSHDRFYFEKDAIFRDKKCEMSEDFIAFCEENKELLSEWIATIKARNPAYVGLSLLTRYSQAMAMKLSLLVREHLPHAKIVWGGPQVKEDMPTYLRRGFLDHYICGDGEFSLVELLKGNLSYPGIDSQKSSQVVDLDQIQVPNYDDINWTEYRKDDFKDIVYITGSRGCVRKCSFCDVYQIWPKYRHRSAKHIIHEIETLKSKYGRQTYKFTDSLINGSIKAYRELLHELVEYKKNNPDFSWISQWIVRPKEFSPEEDFDLLKKSGCLWLEIGIESFSSEIREHMGKKFSNDDIWWCLEMLQKYRIPASLLMIVGYPTETKEDHLMTLETVKKIFDMGYISRTDEYHHNLVHFCFTSTLMLDPSLPLWDMVKDEIKNFVDNLNWEYRDNTMAVRIQRFNEINDLIRGLMSDSGLFWQIEKTLREQNEVSMANKAVPVRHL